MHAQGSGFAWTRRLVVSAAVVALSLAGHAAGSALLPSLPGLTFAVGLTLVLTLRVRAGTSPVRLFALMVGIQALLHISFIVTSGHPSAHAGAMSLVPSTATVIGHVVASLIAVAVLAFGDRVLSSWTALLTSVFGAPSIALPLVPERADLPLPAWDARAFRADSHLTVQVRRGPPAR